MADVIEAEETDQNDSFEDSSDMSCESPHRHRRAHVSNIASSMTFGPEECKASKQIGEFLSHVVLGGYHGDLLHTRDVSEYFNNQAMQNGFARALSDIEAVIDKEGQKPATQANESEVPASAASSPALTPESYLKGNFELLVLKFGGKGKKVRRIQDLDEVVRRSIAGTPNMPSDGNPLPVLFVFTGDCLKEDPYMPWSRPTRAITKHDDLIVSDIFNYIYQSLQDIFLECLLQWTWDMYIVAAA